MEILIGHVGKRIAVPACVTLTLVATLSVQASAAATPVGHTSGPAGDVTTQSKVCTYLGNGNLCVNTRSGSKTSYIDLSYRKDKGAPSKITLAISNTAGGDGNPDCDGDRFPTYARNCSEFKVVPIKAGQRHTYTGTFSGPLDGCFIPVMYYGNYTEVLHGRCAS